MDFDLDFDGRFGGEGERFFGEVVTFSDDFLGGGDGVRVDRRFLRSAFEVSRFDDEFFSRDFLSCALLSRDLLRPSSFERWRLWDDRLRLRVRECLLELFDRLDEDVLPQRRIVEANFFDLCSSCSFVRVRLRLRLWLRLRPIVYKKNYKIVSTYSKI